MAVIYSYSKSISWNNILSVKVLVYTPSNYQSDIFVIICHVLYYTKPVEKCQDLFFGKFKINLYNTLNLWYNSFTKITEVVRVGDAREAGKNKV